MIQFNPKKWQFALYFKTALLKKLWGGMLLLTLATAALTYLHKEEIFKFHFSNALPGYMGAALGLLLVFRNNTAYDKWWEARKEVGALVNTCRNFAIDLNGLLPHSSGEKERITKLLTAFVFSLKLHLRNGAIKTHSTYDALTPEDKVLVENANHKPNVIANIIVSRIEVLWMEKKISDIQQLMLMTKVNGLIDILGKCERIRNTPIPMAYAFLLKFFIVIYIVMLPLGLVDDLGWAGIPLGLILYYILMSIVLTAEEIEEPFGKDLNDLPMDDIAENIRKNISELVTYE